MFVGNNDTCVSQLYSEFVEILETIKLNDYLEVQRKEMVDLFEGRIMQKCLELILHNENSLEEDISQLSDHVLSVVKKGCGTNDTKDCFLKIFDKAVTCYEESRTESLSINYTDVDKEILAVVKELNEIKFYSQNLLGDNDVLRDEIEVKDKRILVLENLQIKLKHDNFDICNQLETIIEENIELKKKLSALYIQNKFDDEQRNENILRLTSEIEMLKQNITEKLSHIKVYEINERKLNETVDDLSLKLKYQEDCCQRNPQSQNNCFKEQETQTEEDHDSAIGVPLIPFSDHPTFNEISCGVEDITEWVTFAEGKENLLVCENEFLTKIEFTSTQKNLSSELQDAWSMLQFEDPEYDRDYSSQVAYPFHDKKLRLKSESNSSDASVETNYFSCIEPPQIKDSVDLTFENVNSCDCQTDLQNQIEDLRLQLAKVESCLKDDKVRKRKSLLSKLLQFLFRFLDSLF